MNPRPNPGPVWAGRKLFAALPLPGRPCVQDVHLRYEKNGLQVEDEPVPWNADALTVEADIDFPGVQLDHTSEFRLGDAEGLAPSAVLRDPNQAHSLRVRFQVPPPVRTRSLPLSWRARLLGQVLVPYLPEQDFLQGLRLETPTLFAQLGDHTVACQAVVAGQCKQLTACGVLRGRCSLLPATDMGLAVELTDPSSARTRRVPARLSAPQAQSREAVVSVTVPWAPVEEGTWAVRWLMGDHPLGRVELRVLSRDHFITSLRLTDSRFLADGGPGPAAPLFVLGSSEPGVAGLCPLELRVRFQDLARPEVRLQEQALATGLAVGFRPAPLPADFREVEQFQLLVEGRSLGTVARQCTPVAAFTPEGSFVPPSEYPWTALNDAELDDHLTRLMAVPGQRECYPGKEGPHP